MVWYYYVNSFVASAASVSGQNKSIKKMSCSKRNSVEVYICMYDRALLHYVYTEKTMTVNSYMYMYVMDQFEFIPHQLITNIQCTCRDNSLSIVGVTPSTISHS